MRANTASVVVDDDSPPPTSFLGLQLGSWVKILLGWLTAAIIGGAGWYLYVRDSIKERPTSAAVETKIGIAGIPVLLNRSDIEVNKAKIHVIQVWQAGHSATEKFQSEQMADQKKALDVIQSDIKKIIRNQNR